MASSVAQVIEPAAPAVDIASVFGSLPAGLRGELLKEFNKVVRNFREGRWEPAELDGGKLCEIAYTIIRGRIEGKYPARATKPPNMEAACLALAQAPATFPRSLRLQIPRMLTALYGVRNDRSVGHVGGDVEPNHMDASFVLATAKWLMGELVRIFHDVSTERATSWVEALVERDLPLVWRVARRKRVLDTSLTQKDAMLVLLYSEPTAVSVGTLVDWLEVAESRYLKRDVLRPAHKAKLIEFDETTELIHLSPVGAMLVETKLSGVIEAYA
jgi:hypothetical protein